MLHTLVIQFRLRAHNSEELWFLPNRLANVYSWAHWYTLGCERFHVSFLAHIFVGGELVSHWLWRVKSLK